MGYRIAYDPTMPWLIATVLVAVGSSIWFYASLFVRRRQRSLPVPMAAGPLLKEEMP